MPEIRFTCPGCQKTLRLADASLAGKKVRCPHCKGAATVPAAPPPEEPPVVELVSEEPPVAQERPPRRAPEEPLDALPAEPRRRRRRPRDDEDREEEAPEPKPQPSLVRALLVGGLLILVGVGGGYYGYREYQLGTKAQAEPQVITCQQLIDRGPGDNVYIALKDFELLGDEFVVESGRGRRRRRDTWKKAWVPVVPAGKVERTGSFAVILETTKVTDYDKLEALEKAPEIRGMVVNDVQSLGSAEARILRDSYPEVDFKKCWIIRHEWSPTDTKVTVALGGACAGLVGLLGVLVVVLALWRRARRRPAVGEGYPGEPVSTPGGAGRRTGTHEGAGRWPGGPSCQ